MDAGVGFVGIGLTLKLLGATLASEADVGLILEKSDPLLEKS
jgi:hypothetical protein